MKERPILFSARMVRALLAGTKTQTRRAIQQQPTRDARGVLNWPISKHRSIGFQGRDVHPDVLEHCPYGQPGDRLWVRETFYAYGRWITAYDAKKDRDAWHFIDMTVECGNWYFYDATSKPERVASFRRDSGVTPMWWKRPAIFMPRAASRIDLDVSEVRAQRLQDISAFDALQEGLEQCLDLPTRWEKPVCFATAVQLYRELWEAINGAGTWVNQWVWAVSFRKVQPA